MRSCSKPASGINISSLIVDAEISWKTEKFDHYTVHLIFTTGSVGQKRSAICLSAHHPKKLMPNNPQYFMKRIHTVKSRARINSWIELELMINSIQFSMNWIGIELKDFELELNWNWKPQLIGIDQFNQFIFNSTPHFTRLNFFVCHIMEIVVWQAIPCKQAYPNAPLCVPSMGSAGVFGHQGMVPSHYFNQC